MAQKLRQDADIVIIRERGINAKGYGHVAKRVMTDPSISISAKGIYAYLSSMAGSGESSFIRRSKLLSELNIGKRGYDANMKQLEDRGYITRAQSRTTAGYWGTTIIEFVMIPSCLADEIFEAQKAETKPTMYSGTVYALGYGSVPRLVMQDSALSLKAKGLYAYFCAYAGPDTDVFPQREKICYELSINKESYNSYKNELITGKYITVYQNHQGGKLSGNTFRINQFPNQVCDNATKAIIVFSPPNSQCTENSTTVPLCSNAPQCTENSTTGVQCTENECTVNQCTENECTENSTTHLINNSTLTINNSSNNNVLLDRLIDTVREKISYVIQMWLYGDDVLACEALDILVDVIVSVLSSPNPRIQIGQEVFFTKHVQEVLMKVSNEAAHNVIERYLTRTDKIDNPAAYLLASIYNEIIRPTPLYEDEEVQ